MDISTDIDLALREATALFPPEQMFVLCDTSTFKLCLPVVRRTLSIDDRNVLVLPAGEDIKTLVGSQTIWHFLKENNATRHSLLICLGGGVITDMGGFAASTYMRGMAFLNIPTTLLSMVDASIGGKTGIDFEGIKNIIGLFKMPQKTILHTPFLRSLPAEEFLSGYAEMIKHTLISSPLQVAALSAFDLDKWFTEEQSAHITNKSEQESELADLILRSVEIKRYIVESDPEENGMRQTLNFGHTIGHALEAFSIERSDKKPLRHGYAVLYGMIAELWLSHIKFNFQTKDIEPLISLMKEYYGKAECSCANYNDLINLMRHDKKNPQSDQITFTLLHSIGNYRLQCVCTEDEIKEALDFLFNT